jgi:hypothetical protein
MSPMQSATNLNRNSNLFAASLPVILLLPLMSNLMIVMRTINLSEYLSGGLNSTSTLPACSNGLPAVQQQPLQQPTAQHQPAVQEQPPFQQPFQQQTAQQQPFQQQQQQQQPFQQQQQQQQWTQFNWTPPMNNPTRVFGMPAQQMQKNYVWGPQQIIIRSKDEQALLKAVKIQMDMLCLFFAIADCIWDKGKLKIFQASSPDYQNEESP